MTPEELDLAPTLMNAHGRMYAIAHKNCPKYCTNHHNQKQCVQQCTTLSNKLYTSFLSKYGPLPIFDPPTCEMWS
jgi:hypothetical protein